MKIQLTLTAVGALLAAALPCSLSAATLYVALESTNPAAPFATWETGATNIQDAVDAAKAGDTVLVTNGVYAVGNKSVEEGSTWNRVTITNAIRLESVNGPSVTTIDGGRKVRCVYLGDDAVLIGFTLTNGASGGAAGRSVKSSGRVVPKRGGDAPPPPGGGVWGGTLYDCTLAGNSAGYGGGAYSSRLFNCVLTRNEGGGAYLSSLHKCTLSGNSGTWGGGAGESTLFNCTLSDNSAWEGGGAYGSTLNNCTLNGNSAMFGGGAWGSTLYNCELTGNSAGLGGGTFAGTLYSCTVTGNHASEDLDPRYPGQGGGAYSGRLYDSIVYYNTAASGANYFAGSAPFWAVVVLNYCCTTPLPTDGIGNITGPPLFMDLAAGDYRLWEGSPCIDAGADLRLLNVGYDCEPTDFLGNTRFIDGNFDGKVAWDIGAYEFDSFRPPRFNVQPQLTADGWKVTVTGAPNKWVHLQRSGNLKDWEDIWSGWMGTEGAQQCNDSDMERKVMFYRAVVP